MRLGRTTSGERPCYTSLSCVTLVGENLSLEDEIDLRQELYHPLVNGN